jgi:hypothetical protein
MQVPPFENPKNMGNKNEGIDAVYVFGTCRALMRTASHVSISLSSQPTERTPSAIC